MGVGAALMLAVIYGATWLLERRLVASFYFLLTALATAGIARCELGMMHATTPAEFGEWAHWYQIPVFLGIFGPVMFVRHYLGAGRAWLAWTVVAMRAVLVGVNFFSYPSVIFQHVYSLGHAPLLGEQVAIIGQAALRPWVWFARASLLLAFWFAIDACVAKWRSGDPESRRKVLMVVGAILAPGLVSLVVTQVALLGRGWIYLDSPASLITLTLMAIELSRDVIVSRRTQLELMQLRDNVVQVGRVGVMGQLASALAHELNQPLGAILRNAEAAELHLRQSKPDLEELRCIVADIRKDDRRAAEIIDRMRALIKRHKVDKLRLVLDEIVRDVLTLTRSEAASKQVAVTYAAPPALPQVWGDRVHLSQVLLNLVVNGLEAVESCPAEARRLVIELRSVSGRVEVSVKDSGPGIPPADMDRIFEPLFTTKSGGLGMGLALCRTIVEAHGGRLWAEGNPQQPGATFRFALPQAGDAAV
jgi:signal transduction histidine kinase